jgi:diguanylate cyclase (GGDEF)-like protein/PAS domain S-box-containing protein
MFRRRPPDGLRPALPPQRPSRLQLTLGLCVLVALLTAEVIIGRQYVEARTMTPRISATSALTAAMGDVQTAAVQLRMQGLWSIRRPTTANALAVLDAQAALTRSLSRAARLERAAGPQRDPQVSRALTAIARNLALTEHEVVGLVRRRQLPTPAQQTQLNAVLVNSIDEARAGFGEQQGALNEAISQTLTQERDQMQILLLLGTLLAGFGATLVGSLWRLAARRAGDVQRQVREIVENGEWLAMTLDASGRIVYANSRLAEMAGKPAEDLVGSDYFELMCPPELVDERRAHHRNLIARSGLPVSREFEVMLSGGERRTVSWAATSVQDQNGKVVGMTAVGLDVTNRNHTEERVRLLANTDQLTGLANRTLLAETLEDALEQAEKGGRCLAVVYIDLDNFKLINDSLGHQSGDELLCQVADRLRHVCDPLMIARPGGDEFFVLVADRSSGEVALSEHPADIEQIVAVMRGRIAAALRRPFELAGSELYVDVSLGASFYPTDGSTADELLRRADIAMYRDKAGHHGQVVVTDSSRELTQTTQLRRACEAGDQFELHYQPVVELQDGRVVSAEALIRWRCPGRGLVAPGDFIPLAERSGLIGPISEWVIGEVCRQQRIWLASGIALPVAFNLPPSLWTTTITDLLEARAAEAGVPLDMLGVELTESALNTEHSSVRSAIERLADIGVRLAIDDFGTGYSSLSRLCELPVSTIKIDRAFITDVASSPQALSVMRAVVALARSIGMTPLAEGVETEAQRRTLIELGCPLAQGFLFSRPVPAEEFARLIAGTGELPQAA